jgi:hypothetical protein
LTTRAVSSELGVAPLGVQPAAPRPPTFFDESGHRSRGRRVCATAQIAEPPSAMMFAIGYVPESGKPDHLRRRGPKWDSPARIRECPARALAGRRSTLVQQPPVIGRGSLFVGPTEHLCWSSARTRGVVRAEPRGPAAIARPPRLGATHQDTPGPHSLQSPLWPRRRPISQRNHRQAEGRALATVRMRDGTVKCARAQRAEH